MSYEQLTTKSPSFLRRFSHRSRYALAADLLDPRPGDRILDYGAGDGELLLQLAAREPDLSLCAFEPTPWCLAELRHKTAGLGGRIRIASDFGGVDGFAPNKVACNEVLEHLAPPLFDEALLRLAGLAARGALIMVSVPIEVGLPGLVKYAVRHRADASYRRSWRELLGVLAGRTQGIARIAEPGGYIPSHFAFDHRSLIAHFERHGLRLQRRVCSPLPALGPWLNSQVFYLLTAAPPR